MKDKTQTWIRAVRCCSSARAGSPPHQDADGGGIDALEAADVDSLRVVAEPVAEVGALNHQGGPFLAVQEGQGLEHVLDVAVAPVVALDLGNRGDVAGAKGGRLAGHHDQDDAQDQQQAAEARSERGHGRVRVGWQAEVCVQLVLRVWCATWGR